MFWRNLINVFFKFKKEVLFVDEYSLLNNFHEEISSSNILGIDTEFDWRSTYFPKLSLLQVISNNKIFLIDCLKIEIGNQFLSMLESENILKIFHSVRSDSTVLSKCLGVYTQNTFDIQIADKYLSSGNIKSYGKIVKNNLGIDIDKSQTNSNWLRRPLTESQIQYAANDVNFLIEISKIQMKKLKKKNLYEKVLKESKQETDLGNKDLKFLRLKKLKNKLTNKQREIFLWRENMAEESNVPPNRICKENEILRLSKIKDQKSKKIMLEIFGDSYLVDQFTLKFL